MKVAVTYNKGKITDRFGKASAFKFYEIDDNKVVAEEVQEIGTNDHDEMADFLKEAGTDKLICGNICLGCQEAVGNRAIDILGCVKGDADAAVAAFLDGTLKYETDPQILK